MTPVDSPLGRLWITGRNGALISLSWQKPRLSPGAADAAVEARAERWLARYFKGDFQPVDFPLAPEGTPFRHKIWDILVTIPAGEVWTYGRMAEAVGTAPRAVGGAMGGNPLPILIPCHRVVAAGGGLGGYSGRGGVETKRRLLALEGVALPKQA